MFSQGYLIDSQICIGLFYIFYRVFLEGKITHYYARGFLVMMIPVALILPLINLPLLPSVKTFVAQIESVSVGYEIIENPVSSSVNYLLIGYLIGVGLMIVWLLVGAVNLIMLLQKSRAERIDGFRVIFTHQRITAYSVFNYIFVNVTLKKSTLLQELLAHEECHIRLRHTFDLLFISMVRAALWFNPLVWHTSRLLRQVHEYQADENVINQGYSKYNYINLLILSEAGINPEFASPMSYSLTKKRLNMLAKKEKVNGRKRLILTIPLLAIMIILFSLTRSTAKPTEPRPSAVETTDTVLIVGYKSNDNVSPLNSDTIFVVGYESKKEPKDKMREMGVTKITYKNGGEPNQPLIIVDNKEWNKPMDDIKPEMIESISVLKDESSLKVYGEKGKNGVILVTLKEGVKQDDVLRVRIADLSQKPLYIVDGQEWKTSLDGIKPETIESVSVLKDESSLKIYGEKGKNGVIIITLKKDESQDKGVVLAEAEVMPKFQGGESQNFSKWVMNKIKHPASTSASINNIQGTLLVSFIINQDGKLINAKVEKGLHEDLDKMVLDIIKESPQWTPGRDKGKLVGVSFKLPIRFMLQYL